VKRDTAMYRVCELRKNECGVTLEANVPPNKEKFNLHIKGTQYGGGQTKVTIMDWDIIQMDGRKGRRQGKKKQRQKRRKKQRQKERKK
jgi:hypothetical protein